MSHERATEAFTLALAEDDPVQLYDRAPCGYLSTTPDGRIVKANATFQTWTGYAAAELLGRTFAEMLTVGGRIYHETHYMPLLMMQESVREIALEVVRRDGSRLPVLVNARLERDESGAPRIIRVAVFDATERREYERELLRAKERAEASERHASALARTLQQTLIPPLPPAIPDLDVAAAYRPAGDGSAVGGDFYDVFEIGTDDWMVAVGDVCGKGVDAAVVTALVRYAIRALAVANELPSDVLRRLDDVVHRHETDRFCTVLLIRLRKEGAGWSATVGTGGHPPPVLLRSGLAPAMLQVHGSLVGVLPSPTFSDVRLHLEAGDGLLVYTDGVTEARREGEFFGESGLIGVVDAVRGRDVPRGGRAAEVVGALVDRVLAFQSGWASDDITVVGLVVPDAADACA